VDVVGGVDESVEHRLGDDGVGEQGGTGGGPVGDEDQRAVLAFGEELVAMPTIGTATTMPRA
jgi:hypothetical protein